MSFDLNIRRWTENPAGEATSVTFRCGCKMRPAGPGLVLRSCCRDHVPNEDGEFVVLGALSYGPWLIDGPVLRIGVGAVWMGADQRNATLAQAMSEATDPALQAVRRAEAERVDRLFGETAAQPPEALSESQTLVSESQTFLGRLRLLRRLVRDAAEDFWNNFQI